VWFSWGRALAVALLLAASAPVAGCASSTCFLKTCDDDGNCKCSVSNCGDGSSFDFKTQRCKCDQGNVSVQGQCMAPDDANAFCGQTQHWEGTGCVSNGCRPGDELDQSTGKCIPHEQVNALAAQSLGVQVGQGQKLGCPDGQKLIVDGPNAACVPLAQTCAHDEAWNGQACVKTAQCSAGSSWDAAQGQCVVFAKPSGTTEEKKVDVAQWAQTNFGVNGGPGTAAFCGAFAKKPYLFGINAGASATIRATLNLAFEGGDVAKGNVSAQAVFDSSAAAVPPRGVAEIEASAKALLAALVKGGGKSATPTATTTVKCAIVSAAKPVAVPATGGL
jgi:hypothetical protein